MNEVIDMKTRSKIDCQGEGEIRSLAEIGRAQVISEFINKLGAINVYTVASLVGGKFVQKCLSEMGDAVKDVKGEFEE